MKFNTLTAKRMLKVDPMPKFKAYIFKYKKVIGILKRHFRELKIFHIFPDLISETKFGVIGSTCCSLSAVRLMYFLQAYFKEIIISVNYFRYDRDVFIAIAYGLLDPNFPVSARTMYLETFEEIC